MPDLNALRLAHLRVRAALTLASLDLNQQRGARGAPGRAFARARSAPARPAPALRPPRSLDDIRWNLGELRNRLAWARFDLLQWKARSGYDPDQPRVPAGNPDGGQWTRLAGPPTGGGRTRYGGNFPGATPRQMARLDAAIGRTQRALDRIRQQDPNWKPKTSSLTAPGSIEGAIRHAEARAAEAEARSDLLRSGIGGNLGPRLEPPRPGTTVSSSPAFDGAAWINAYRAANNMPDLFGNPNWPGDKGTVAVTEVDGRLIFGTNSSAPPYEATDRQAALSMRDRLVQSSGVMSTNNLGRFPNDSLFHAEATVLLRAAEAMGGTLEGRAIEVHVDRALCSNCDMVLPYLGVDLDNPTVTFVHSRDGSKRTMRNGKWD